MHRRIELRLARQEPVKRRSRPLRAAVALVASGICLVALVCPACAESLNGEWVNKSLGCDRLVDNECLRVVHRRHDYDAIERQRRQYRAYLAREAERRAERREERREEWREERRDERREERATTTRGRVEITRYRERGRDIEVRTYSRTECLPSIRRVGTEHISEDNAKRAAENAWSEEVRYRHGERWMAVKSSRNPTYVCTQSSTAEGIVNRAEAAVGLIKVRCEIEAQPCLPSPLAEK